MIHAPAPQFPPECLQKVDMQGKENALEARNILLAGDCRSTNDGELRRRWLALVLYLSPDITAYTKEFQEVLLLPL